MKKDIEKEILQQLVAVSQDLGNLRGEMKAGFNGVHTRQDTTNGRIGKVEIRVDMLEKKDEYQKGGNNTAKYIIGLILAVATIIATLYGSGILH